MLRLLVILLLKIPICVSLKVQLMSCLVRNNKCITLLNTIMILKILSAVCDLRAISFPFLC